MSKVCPRCKRAHPAIKDAAGRIIILPHSTDGKPVKWPDVCGRKS